MSAEVGFDEVNDCLVVKYDMLPTAEEFESVLAGLVTSGNHAPDTNMLYDMTAIDYATVNRTLMERFIAIREKYPQRANARIAVLVSSKVGFGLGRMYELLSERLGQRIMVFYDRTQAEQWVRGSRAG